MVRRSPRPRVFMHQPPAEALLHGSTTEPIWCRRRRRSRRHRGGLRRPERQHRVQHGAPHHRFALLRLEPLRPETAAEDPFVPEERTLHAGLLPVTGFFLPRLSSDLGNPLDMPVPLRPGARRLRRRRRRPSRRDDDLDAGTAGRADRRVHAARVVGAVAREAPQREHRSGPAGPGPCPRRRPCSG